MFSEAVLLHDIARYHEPLHLAGALVYFCYPGVSVVPLHRHVRHVAHSSQHLKAVCLYPEQEYKQ